MPSAISRLLVLHAYGPWPFDLTCLCRLHGADWNVKQCFSIIHWLENEGGVGGRVNCTNIDSCESLTGNVNMPG